MTTACGSPTPSRALIEDVVAPALRGVEVASPEDGWADLLAYFLAVGNSRGPAMEALAGVDIALWDLMGKRADRPLAELLGGKADAVPTYASPVPFCLTPAQSADRALAFERQGFRALKLKIGRDLQTDLAHIGAVRRALSPETALMLDANCGYDRKTALELVDRLDDMAIGWLEEPLDPEDFDGLQALCRAAPFPIAGGENDFTDRAFARLADIGLGVLQPNITRALGVTGLRRIDQLAGDAGAVVAPHGVGASIGVAAALHCCAASTNLTLFEANCLLNPLRDEVGIDLTARDDGTLMPPPGAGHGGTARIDPRSDVLDPPVVEMLRRASAAQTSSEVRKSHA